MKQNRRCRIQLADTPDTTEDSTLVLKDALKYPELSSQDAAML